MYRLVVACYSVTCYSDVGTHPTGMLSYLVLVMVCILCVVLK